jgi:hypothetical protein
MCQVLFSVLVLHWVTSKDSNGGSTADKSNSHRSGNNVPSQTAGLKFGADKFRYGHNGVGPTVTTHISAARDVGNLLEDDDEISKTELGTKNNKAGVPLGRITVQVGQVREVEGREGRTSVVSATPVDGRSYRSTEDLVERTET